MDQGRRSGPNRKRRYRDDDDGFDRRNKRRHYEEPPHTKLRKQLLGFTESTSKQLEDVSSLSTLILEAGDDVQLRNTLIELVPQVIVEQPFKIPVLAAIAHSVNSQKSELVGKVISTTCDKLNDHLAQGSWREIKLLLRFLACLQDILSDSGVFPILDELFARAADLQTASAEDGLGLEIVKIILLTLAYAMKSSATANHEDALEVLRKTEIVATASHKLDPLVDPFLRVDENSSGEPSSFISLLQHQMQQESVKDWELRCIPKLTESNSDANRHRLSTIAVPVNVTSTSAIRLPEIFFSVYSDQEVETVPPKNDIASTVIRDVLVDVMNGLDFNRTAAARALLDIDCFFPEGTFAKRATPVDKLKEQQPDRSTWKPEDVAVDAVFSQLTMLPFPDHKMVYYHSLLTEACRIAPAAVAPSLGRAIRFMYQRLETVDLEVAYRFNDWFSHHLSNFGFTWKWTEWTPDLELPAVHPKKAFITATLDKEMRLSFAQRIRGTVPEQYYALIPETKDKDIPDYKFGHDEVPHSQQAREVLRIIRQKGPDAELQNLLASVEREAVDQLVADPVAISTDVYMTSICFAGAKSLSHVLNCIERCKERLLNIVSKNDSARLQIIDSVLEYWRDKPGVGVNIIDKLLNYTILTPMAVVQWAFVANLKAGEILSQTFVFEMISGTIDKVSRRIRQIVMSRRRDSLTVQQQDGLNQALTAESKQFQQLFTVVEDALRSIAAAGKDEHLEHNGYTDAEQALLSDWGRRWLKSLTRKMAIEQAWVKEMLARPVPAAQDTSEPIKGEAAPAVLYDGQDGNVNANGAN